MTKHWHSNKTQVYWACKALITGRTINHMDEIGETKGWRLGAIVHNLRQKYNWPINTVYVGPENIAHYSLDKGCAWRHLKFPKSASALKSELPDG
jgi:hypothetical protein